MARRIQPLGNPAAARGIQPRSGNPPMALSRIWAQAFETHRSTNSGRADAYADTSTFDAMASSTGAPGTYLVQFSPRGAVACLDAVRVYLKEKDMWLTVQAPKGTNNKFPNNISIGSIKGGLSLAASTYEGQTIYIYDATESFSEDRAVSGGYEYLDDYVVAPGVKLYASLESQNVAGVHDPAENDQRKEWDGLTWIQLIDESRWTQVMLPDALLEGQVLTCNMLKRSALAKINMKATKEVMQSMRVFHNSGGIPTGAPFAGKDEIYAHHWYTVVIGWDSRVLVMTAGQDLPSPDSSSDAAGWELTASP